MSQLLHSLTALLQGVRDGTTSVEEALETLKRLPYEDLGFAHLDHHRALRQGFPEIVMAQWKTTEQVVQIVQRMVERHSPVLITRASPEVYEALRTVVEEAVYHPLPRLIVVDRGPDRPRKPGVLVVTGGTSDIPVAEEAAITAEVIGNQVERLYDVGVAGLHRLLDRSEALMRARVVVVVAGMEGALASVVGGLVSVPVIAVPTSVGYGASFGGVAALLAMLNSCALGVAVVNIDNGVGAGYLAGMINQQAAASIRGSHHPKLPREG